MKKVILALFTLSLFGMAFAEQPGTSASRMSSSTQGLFKTDVDNYMSLDKWDSVKPANLFGYLGYDGSHGGINFGVAHQFKPVYLGFYFGGQFDEVAFGKKVTENIAAGTSVTTKTTKSKGEGDFDTGLIFGFGNMAVRPLIHVKIEHNETSNADTDPVEITKDQVYNVTPMVDFGMKSKLGKWDAVYSADLAIEIDHDITDYGNTSNKEKFTDNSTTNLYLGGGMSLERTDKNFTHNISVGMENKIYFYPSIASSVIVGTESAAVTQNGRYGYALNLTPSYKLTYPATKTVTLKFMVASPVSMEFGGDEIYTETKGTKLYNNRETSFEMGINPTVTGAVLYQVKPNLSLNAGIGFHAPEMTVSSSKQNTVNSTTGEVTAVSKSTSLSFDKADGYCALSSGLTWNISKNVTLDASYEILANLFGGDLKSDLIEGYSGNFWNNVNKAFVHNIALQVSAKF